MRKINKGQKLWKKAKKIIPGGNMLFSKRSELILPDKWLSYYSKTKDAFVWDLDNKKYLDMMFFVGTSTLGYNHPKINKHVNSIINKGVMSSLNCFEEVKFDDYTFLGLPSNSSIYSPNSPISLKFVYTEANLI